MADFDDFEATPAEVDPAAEFLAREQSELAGLEDDNFGVSSGAGNEGDNTFGDEVPNTGDQGQSLSDGGLGDFEVVGDPTSDAGGFGGDEGLLGGGPSNNLDEPATNGPSSMYEAISQQDTIRAEPEQIRIWREAQALRLEDKDVEETKRKDELRDIAMKELNDWYRHHVEQLEKTKENNREQHRRASESAFVKERDETIPGQTWEKITRLCEFNPKNSKTTKDVSRLRSVLLQLKQMPLVR